MTIGLRAPLNWAGFPAMRSGKGADVVSTHSLSGLVTDGCRMTRSDDHAALGEWSRVGGRSARDSSAGLLPEHTRTRQGCCREAPPLTFLLGPIKGQAYHRVRVVTAKHFAYHPGGTMSEPEIGKRTIVVRECCSNKRAEFTDWTRSIPQSLNVNARRPTFVSKDCACNNNVLLLLHYKHWGDSGEKNF